MEPPIVGGMDAGRDDAGPPVDATSDISIGGDADLDGGGPDGITGSDGAVLDGGGMTDGGMLDGGKCGSPIGAYGVHWPFDEPLMATTIYDEKKAYSAQLIANATLIQSAPCGNALNFAAANSISLDSSNWKASPNIYIGFGLTYQSGTGVVLERHVSNTGGWIFYVSGGSLVFGVYSGVNLISVSCPVTGKLSLVVGKLENGAVSLNYGACAAAPVQYADSFQAYTAPVYLGSGGIKFTIDEIYLGP